MKKFPVLILLAALPLLAPAKDDEKQDLEAVPAPPEIPEPLQSGEPIEPDVTIIHKEEGVIEEYRVNGILYMVKVTPKVGKPYYLIDRDGDGSLETRRGGIKEDPSVPQWILFSW